MKLTAWIFLLAVSISYAAQAADLASADVPESFESISASSADAYDFAKGCVPGVAEKEFTQMVANAGENKTVTNRPGDKSKPYLSITAGKVYCVRVSAANYPIVPLSAFNNTLMFNGMDKEQEKQLRTDLSRQLAATGFATVTVIGEKNNLYKASYLFASARPIKMYYHLSYMKADEVQVGNGEKVYMTTGSVSEVARGQTGEQENMRFFFSN